MCISYLKIFFLCVLPLMLWGWCDSRCRCTGSFISRWIWCVIYCSSWNVGAVHCYTFFPNTYVQTHTRACIYTHAHTWIYTYVRDVSMFLVRCRIYNLGFDLTVIALVPWGAFLGLYRVCLHVWKRIKKRVCARACVHVYVCVHPRAYEFLYSLFCSDFDFWFIVLVCIHISNSIYSIAWKYEYALACTHE